MISKIIFFKSKITTNHIIRTFSTTGLCSLSCAGVTKHGPLLGPVQPHQAPAHLQGLGGQDYTGVLHAGPHQHTLGSNQLLLKIWFNKQK